jgi:hypothetical protein
MRSAEEDEIDQKHVREFMSSEHWVNLYKRGGVRRFDEELKILDTDTDGEEEADVDVDESTEDIDILYG